MPPLRATRNGKVDVAGPAARYAPLVSGLLGRYEICGKLAEGGMATIYLARLRGPKGFGRTVALKMLRPECALDPNFVAMFIDEATLLAKLAHPNIVQIYELGEEEGQLFIAMEMLFGESLAVIWDECRMRNARLRGDLVAWIGARVAEALHHAHDLCDTDGSPQNIVHRDVNPTNLFVTYDGHVKLLDFGLVKAVRKVAQTQIGVIKGKLAYLSPEQVTGKPIDRRSDIFSLAATLYEVSTDQRLFKRDTDEGTIEAVRDALVPDPTSSVPDYPSLLWLVLRRALEREPDHRYATAQELARDLDGVARAQGSIIQTSTLAEIMGELFGKERVREISLLRAGALRTEPALSALRQVPVDGQDRRSSSTRARRVHSPYLIPTTIEPSIISMAIPPLAPRRSRKFLQLSMVIGAALVAALTATVTVLWQSCRTDRDDAAPARVGSARQ
jgi:serine/threonine protein kinase